MRKVFAVKVIRELTNEACMCEGLHFSWRAKLRVGTVLYASRWSPLTTSLFVDAHFSYGNLVMSTLSVSSLFAKEHFAIVNEGSASLLSAIFRSLNS